MYVNINNYTHIYIYINIYQYIYTSSQKNGELSQKKRWGWEDSPEKSPSIALEIQ